jgi:lactose/L-arabinose transport system substrate-binding protein
MKRKMDGIWRNTRGITCIAIVALALLLTGCGSGGASAGKALEATPADASGTLTVWGWDGTYEGIRAMIEPFAKAYPNIKVDVKTMGYDDVHKNLLNAIVAGTGAPDLCAIDVLRLSQYTDGLVDLTATAQKYKDDFVPPTFSTGTFQGKFYGLATDSEPIGMFYRSDIWAKYGITEESIETWDDLAAADGKVFDASNGSVMLYTMSSDFDYLLQIMAVEQGFRGYYFSDDDSRVIVDDPKMIEAMTVMKRLWDAKGVVRDPKDGYSGTEALALLKNGTIASQMIGPGWYPLQLKGSMPELSGKWRLMRVPAIKKGGARVGYQFPSIVVMSQQSKLKGAAWELSRMSLLGEGAKALFDLTAVLPAYKPLFDSLKDVEDPYFGGQKINTLWGQIAKDSPAVFFGRGFPEAQTIMVTHMRDILQGKTTPEAGMKAAATEMRDKLKRK